jgi:hypothetical protein
VRVLASNGCFSASTVLALSKYATIYFNGVPFEHGYDNSGSIKDREFFDQMSDCQPLKKDFAIV